MATGFTAAVLRKIFTHELTSLTVPLVTKRNIYLWERGTEFLLPYFSKRDGSQFANLVFSPGEREKKVTVCIASVRRVSNYVPTGFDE